MQNTFVILVLCFLLFDLKETSGKLNGSASGSKKTDKVRKGQLNPDDLNKKLLDVNSEEEDLAERMIVYIDGKKKKPKNLNKSPKNFELAQRMDTHPKRKMKPQLPQLPTRRKKRLFVPEDNLKWPNRQIPYSIQTRTYRNLGDIQQKFDEAVIKFNDAACVTWAPRTSESTYINVIGNEATCASYVGYNSGRQDLWLYEFGCVYVDIVLHEMLHAAGAMHEQSREADRDPIITYNWDAISRDDEFNYRGIRLTNARQYDLGSVLQYELTFGSTTYMISNDPDLAYLPRQIKSDLSFYDKAELNAFYQCADDCVNPPTCQNEGFVKQTRGVCSCVCVDGLTGADCSQLDTSPGCGEIITLNSGESQQISMSPYTTGLKCTWLVKGADKTKIRLTVDSMDIQVNDQDACNHFLEIRDYLSGAPGKLVCGNSGGGVFTKKCLGPSNMMVVRFDSDTYDNIAPGSGFAFTVEAAPSACSSNPCKYPATCVDGATTDDYTCQCTAGYSGTNCDTVSASAEVTDSFEDGFTTLMRHVTTGVDFQWSTGLYFDMNRNQIQASDGHLMAQMINPNFKTPFYYESIAKMETSAKFESAKRCLRFDYALSNRDLGSSFVTKLTVKVMSDSGTTPHQFSTSTGNVWTTAEINLPAASNLKIEFEAYFGDEELAVDNIRISPLLCNAPNPCDGVVCQNSGYCQVTAGSTPECQCQTGFSGQFCQNDVCSGNTCVNGACTRVSDTEYTCQCDEGWFGENCDTNPCSTNDCVNGACSAVSATEYICQCDEGWFGDKCDIDPCSANDCVNGACSAVSATEFTCQCNEGWFGDKCDIDPCATNNCVNGECVALSETETECDCSAGWTGTLCDSQLTSYTCDFEVDPEAGCFLKESTNEDFDFTRKSGATPSARTGPSRAASGNYYKFTESSSPRSRGDEASLESYSSFKAGTYCLRLSISMYGSHIGSLEILTKEGTSAEVRHKIYSGNQGRNWFNYSKELTLTPLTKIIIRTKVGGNRRNSYKGDIAVDNILLENGACV